MMLKVLISGIFIVYAVIAQIQQPNISEALVNSIFGTEPYLPETYTETSTLNLNSLRDLNISPNLEIVPEAAANYTGCGQKTGKVCVPVVLCNDTDFVITDGTSIIDIRFDPDIPQECPSLERCCSLANRVNTTIITPKETPEGCGYRNVDGLGFEVISNNNQLAQYGEFPWMVAILQEERIGNQIFYLYKCGGSLIHLSVVLTAAHCADSIKQTPQKLLVRAGEWDTQTKAEIFPHQDRRVVNIRIHENYYRGALFNDIALLFVQSPFEKADNVRTICLPPPNISFDYARCIATGWGKDTFGQNGKYQVIMKKVDLPVIPRGQCQAELRKTRLGEYFQLHESFICAGGEAGKDTCKGDGGSPLVCPIQGNFQRYAQAGIVAWGIGCGDAIPAVYVNVPHLRPWINEQLAYNKIDHAAFTP